MAESDALYNGMLSDINDLIDELGTSYTLFTPGEYDPDTLTTGAETSRTVDGVVTDQPITFASPADWVARKRLVMKASALPQEIEEVEIDGRRYPMTEVAIIKPADITIAYELDVSR